MDSDNDWDDESDLSFEQRQKELKSIHKDFKKVLSDIKTISESSKTEIFDEDDNKNSSSFDKFAEQNYSEQIIENVQVRALIRELYSMKSETMDLQSIVLRAGAEQRELQENLLTKFKTIDNIVSKLIQRAEQLIGD